MIIVDFETTGLLRDGVSDFLAQPGIVQCAVLRFNKGTKTEEFCSFVNPEMSIEPEAQKTHGITLDQVAGAPTFFELFPRLSEFCLGETHWIGYNTKFDKLVLWHQLCRYGFERNFPWPPREIDVMRLVEARLNGQGKQGSKRWKLTDAYREIIGKEMEGAHDAMADVRATYEIYMELTA